MLKTIYIVRHGETDWNKEGRVQGWTNTNLNQTGIDQAKKIAEWFESKQVDSIYSSDLIRTQETAKYLCVDKKIKAQITNLLRGRNFGQVSGMTWDEIKKDHAEVYKNIIDESHEVWSKMGMESVMSIKSRVQAFFNKINPNDEHIVLITHGVIRRHILRFFGLISIEERPKIKNTDITIIDLSNKSKFTFKTVSSAG